MNPERVYDAIDAMIDAQDLLIVLEAAIATFIERNSTTDAEIAGDHLVHIARRRIYDATDILFDVKSVVEQSNQEK